MKKPGGLFLLILLFSGWMAVRGGNTIAISYFDNTSEDIRYAALSKGIADMLITDLSRIQGLSIVEREDLEKLLKEIELGKSKYFDSQTAQKLGKGLGATSILTGAFMVLEDNMRIDARLVEVATGRILSAESVTGTRTDFFSLHRQLVALLTKALKVKDAQASAPSSRIDLNAVLKYSEAIDQQDKGLHQSAGDLLASTVNAYPQFTFAKDRLEELKAWLKKAEAEREKLLAAETENLLSTVSLQDPQAGQKIGQVWTTLLTSYSYSGILVINKRLREKGIPDNFRLYGEGSPMTFGEMMLYYEALALYSLKNYHDLLRTGKEFIAKYPTSMYYSGIKMYLDESIKELEAREKGKSAFQQALQTAEFEACLEQLDRLANRWKLEQMSRNQYEHFREVFTRQVLSPADADLKRYVEAKGDHAGELFEFKEAAAFFLDTVLLDRMAKKAVSVYSGTEMEETGYRVEEWTLREKQSIARNIRECAGVKEKSGRKSALIFSDIDKAMDALDFGLAEKAARECLAKGDPDSYRSRTWEYLIKALIRQGKWADAEAEIVNHEKDKLLADKDPVSHRQDNRRLKTLLTDAKKAEAELGSEPLQVALLKARAEVCNQLHQYADEAYTRRQLLDRYVLEEVEGSTQLYLLMTAYTHLGYFDKARETALELQKKYPNNPYASALEYTVKFMPR